MTFMLIKDPKCKLKDQKCQLKDPKSQLKDQKCRFISKELIYIEKVDPIQSLLIYFWSLSIEFEHFDGFLSRWNWFRGDDSDDKFGSKKSIKRRFESDTKWIIGLPSSGFCQ